MVDFADTSTAGDPLLINALRRAAGLPPLVPPGLVMGRETPVAPAVAAATPVSAPAATSTPYLRTPELRPAAASSLPVASTGSSPLTAGAGLPALRPGTLTPPDPHDPQYQLHGAKKVGLGILGGLAGLGGHLDVAASLNPYNRALQGYQRNVEAQKSNLAMEDTQSQIEQRRADAARATAAANKPESIDQELAKATMKAIGAGADPTADPTVKSLIAVHNEAADKTGAPKVKDVKVDDQGNAIGVMEDGSTKQLGFKAGKEAGAATYEHATIEDPKKPGTGKEALFDKAKGQYLDPDTKQPIANAKPFVKPEKPEKGPPGTLYNAEVNGRTVSGTPEQLKKVGVKDEDMVKVGAENVTKIENARVLDEFMNDTDKDNPGIIPLAKKLEASGKLGPIMSRYQDFINKTGSALGFESGDPDFQRLMTGMGLQTTALMQVHVGSRGGAALLEHFEDLAKVKGMSGPAFLAALDFEAKYVKRKAEYPDGGGSGAGGGGGGAASGAGTGLDITRDANGRIIGVK